MWSDWLYCFASEATWSAVTPIGTGIAARFHDRKAAEEKVFSQIQNTY